MMMDKLRKKFGEIVGKQGQQHQLGRLVIIDFERERDKVAAEYERVEIPAFNACKKATAPAWSEYKKAEGPALAEYDRIRSLAWSSYMTKLAEIDVREAKARLLMKNGCD